MKTEHSDVAIVRLSNNNQNLNCKDNELIFCDNSVEVQGDRNNMDLRCKNISGDDCTNFVLEGNDNTQNLDCESVGASGCINRVLEIGPNNGNTQTIDCKFVSGGCENTARGNGNVQDLNCIRSTQCTNEINTPTDGNTQKTVCVNSGTCHNDGTNTKVISVKSDNCENDDASGSTTFCVNNRIINRPNS